MFKQTKVWLVAVIVLSLLVLATACSKTEDPGTAGNSNSGTTASKTPPTGDATVTGTIAYNGTPPAAKKIDTSADPVCGQKDPNLMTEDTLVKDGKLANAFVYIKDGTLADGSKIGDYAYTVPTEAVTLDQSGCHYRPHVLGVQAKQKLRITNSDPTQHNIHPTPKVNPEWNQTQPNGAAPIEKSFDRPEVLIPVKCNQHPWMKAYVGVMKNPFYAVTGEDGSFTLKNVPAGKYTIAAWHEKGGPNGTEKTMEVTVAAGGSAKADFAFGDGASASTVPGLKMMPALDLPMLGRH